MAAADIKEVVEEFVTLKKAGAGYKGLCPFHQEKSPSFTVTPTRGIFKCFGCGKGGNAVTFLEEHEKLNYPEAIKWLARKYGIDLEETQSSAPENGGETRESLRAVLLSVQKFFSSQLLDSQEGQTLGLNYLKSRGISVSTIEKYGLGWAPTQRDGLLQWARQQQINIAHLTQLGLLKGEEGQLRDAFWERVIFPIFDMGGTVIGFGGRTVRNDAKTPKYINSSESSIYNKGQTLYGLFQSKNAIRKADEYYLVEGYLDVLSLHQCGIENAAASSGTSLTAEQLALGKRLASKPIFFYDGDSAGRKAAAKGIELALQAGMLPFAVKVEPNEDPDSLARRFSHAEMQGYLGENTTDFVGFLIHVSLDELNKDSITKAAAAKAIIQPLSYLKDPITLDVMVQQAARGLNMNAEVIYDQLKKNRGEDFRKSRNTLTQPKPEANESAPPQLNPVNLKQRQEEHLIGLLLKYGNESWNEQAKVAEFIFHWVTEWRWHWESEKTEAIYDAAAASWTRGSINTDTIMAEVGLAEQLLMASLLSEPYELYEGWEKVIGAPPLTPESNYHREIAESMDLLVLKNFKQLRRQLAAELEAAAGNDEEETGLLRVRMALDKKVKDLMLKYGTVTI